MKLLAINSYRYKQNINHKPARISNTGLKYQKTDHHFNRICFKGKDLLELSEKEIFAEIKKSLTPENFIGQGTEAEVYRIKDTNYCVRIPHITSDLYIMNYSKELSPIDKVNHTKVKLGFGATIMPYFEGVISKDYKNNEYQRFKLQEKVADMPVKSYTDLLHQIANAIDNEMVFDFSGGNLIINTKKNKLTAIDFYGIADNPRQICPLTEMYSALTCYGSQNKTGKKIYDKIVNTALNEFKPDKIPCMDIELFDFTYLAIKRNCDNNKYRHSSSISKNIHKFNCLKKSISDNLTTLKQLKKMEILDKTIGVVLNEKINSFRNLMLKIR